MLRIRAVMSINRLLSRNCCFGNHPFVIRMLGDRF